MTPKDSGMSRSVLHLLMNTVLALFCLALTVWGQETEEPKPISYPRIRHQGQVQLQFNSGSLGSTRATSDSPANNGVADFPATDRLFFRRIRPVWVVEFSPQLELDTEFEIDLQDQPFDEVNLEKSRVEMLDFLLRYSFTDSTSVALGRYKVPFGWEGLRSSRTINTVERSDVTVYCYPERDVGLTFYHDAPELGEFAIGSFLGQPRSNGGANGNLDLIGRANFRVTEELRLGASGHIGTFRPTGSGIDIPVRRFGAEAQWSSGPFKVESEAIYSDGYNTASDADSRAFGYYLSGIYQIAEPLDFVISYDRFDPDLDQKSVLAPSNRIDDRDRKVIGLNYYISREPIHRVMLNYEMRQSLEGPALDRNGFRLRYQIAW